MQYPQPTNEAPYPQAMPKGDGPSQMHFNSGQPHAHAPNPHARPSYPHPHPSAHFEHPHYPSSTPFSRFWGWTGSYAVPPPPAGPALGPYPHPHPHTPASVHHHAYFRRSCRPRSRLFVPILLVVGGVVAYKRLQRDIEDVRTQAVDREGRPLRSSTERRWEEWRDRAGGWREREEEMRRMRGGREGEEKWEERWRAAMSQQQQQQSPAVAVEQQKEQEKWV
ncbi:hypothetical protein NBRC10512_007033 [Rhodotorula toruloides]|uniref:RHTO0S16e02630g1_1 n=2 Tax=Rhodotorula toruloides TaxID=5286 RepID=A0A061BDV8_RHOTO|nr:uncharacterized protein RHTO_02271 [Rhodotorula toruloides NP11]EMS20909.1 hypothetical protein RHTO_02271 [Rhodotorula toruloides NP11]CDR48164.1 RHTO0S16e02630g1_1 [Rhodotorula toruloides]